MYKLIDKLKQGWLGTFFIFPFSSFVSFVMLKMFTVFTEIPFREKIKGFWFLQMFSSRHWIITFRTFLSNSCINVFGFLTHFFESSLPPYPHNMKEVDRRYASELDVLTGVTRHLTPSPVCMWELHPRKFYDIPYNKVGRFSLLSLLTRSYKQKTFSRTPELSLWLLLKRFLNSLSCSWSIFIDKISIHQPFLMSSNLLTNQKSYAL